MPNIADIIWIKYVCICVHLSTYVCIYPYKSVYSFIQVGLSTCVCVSIADKLSATFECWGSRSGKENYSL